MRNIKMKNSVMIVLLGLMISLASCVKDDFDKPPVGTLPVGDVYTVAQLQQMFADSGAYMINYDASVYAVVTMDESSGNIYKSAYVQDNTTAVNLHMNEPGGLRVGDSVRIYLKGIVLSEYGGMFQLDNVNNDSNVVIIANNHHIQPETVTLDQLDDPDLHGKLVKLEDVQFTETELGLTFADPGDYGNRTLEDCNSHSATVRTSDYATFAETKLPEGKGWLVAINGTYNSKAQLLIRTISEVKLDGERCDGTGGEPIDPVAGVEEHFDDVTDYENVNIPGWRNEVVAGTRMWQGKTHNDNKYAQATGYNSGLDAIETWLITPPVINTSGDKILSFKSAMAYWHHEGDNKPLTVLAATDYDGTNFETANWTELEITLADAGSGDYNWVESGDVSLADFTGNVAIAFKYVGSDTESTSIQLDDVLINTGGGGGGNPIPPVARVDEHFDSVEDYENVNLDGWSDIVVEGNRAWQGKSFDANKYAQATGYNSEADYLETWLITPPVINTSGDMVLSFKNAMAYWQHTSGQPLTILVSTDYDGTNFETATWTEITTANLANENNDNYAWVESGEIPLSDYTGNVCVAFKYVGSGTETTSIQVDDVLIDNGGGGGGEGVTSIDEDFESQTNYEDINLPGWLNTNTVGSRNWQGKEFDENLYAQATSYNSGESNECWLITPKMNLGAMSNPVFEFDNAQAYWVHDGLTVLISTDFDGTNIGAATWTELDCNLAGQSTPDHEWVNSGQIDLSGYSGEAYIGFRYIGSDPDQTTSYRLDNVKLYER
jgi:hypothetical protein